MYNTKFIAINQTSLSLIIHDYMRLFEIISPIYPFSVICILRVFSQVYFEKYKEFYHKKIDIYKKPIRK